MKKRLEKTTRDIDTKSIVEPESVLNDLESVITILKIMLIEEAKRLNTKIDSDTWEVLVNPFDKDDIKVTVLVEIEE